MKFLLPILFSLATPAFAAPEIYFWHSMAGSKAKLMDELIGEYNQSLPFTSGKIRAEFVGNYEDALNKLRTSTLARRGPHLMQVYEIGTRVMTDSRVIVPLQEMIDRDPSFPSKALIQRVTNYYSDNQNRLLAMPFASSNPILFLNDDLRQAAGITKPPQTFAELEDQACRLSHPQQKITGITWPLHAWFFEQFVARQGGELVDGANGRQQIPQHALFAEAAGLNVLNMWQKLVKQRCFANVGKGWDPAEYNFVAGRSAMFVTSTASVADVINKARFKVSTAPIPGTAANQCGGVVIGGNALWLIKGKPAAEQQTAYEFLKYWASAPVQRRWHLGTGYFPIRHDVIQDLEKSGHYQKFPAAKTSVDQLLAAADCPATRGALVGVLPELRQQVESAIELVLNDQLDPAAALCQAAAKSDKAMARYRRLSNLQH